MDSILIPTGYERTLPPGVQLTVRTRRRVLARRARGRVLDLGGAASHGALWESHTHVTDVVRLEPDGPDLDSLTKDGQEFDSVFSVFRMAAAADLDEQLAQLRSLLAPDGVLLFLEPGRLTGPAGRAQRLVAPSVARATGWRADLDIPATLRAAKLSITDIQRHRPGTVQWWIRTLVEGSAHHSLLDD